MLRFIKGSYAVFRLSENILQTTINNAKGNYLENLPCILHKLETGRLTRFYTTSETSNEPNFAEVTGGDLDLEHKLKVLMLEMEVLRQEANAIPDNSSMKTDNWKELLKLNSKSARRKYLQFLFKIEKKKENSMKKKELKRLEWENNPKPKKEDNVYNYDLGHNHIFLRFYDTTINKLYNNRLVQAAQFGQKLVVDCGYHKDMTKRENSNCSKQLLYSFAENRMHTDPFDLHYCNVDHQSGLIKGLHKFIVTMYEPWFPLHLHEESYLDLFPKEELVYLTPHCRDVMKEYDHNATYIIGGIVDKVNNEPLSLAKAKKEGIRMLKLPLDYYLDWGAGSGKSLTINQVLSILLDIKHTGDWKHALRHVPRRKLSNIQLQYAVNKFNSRAHFNKKIPIINSKGRFSSRDNLDNLSFNRIQKNYVNNKIESKNSSHIFELKSTFEK